MTWLEGAAGIPLRQLTNLRELLAGRSVTTPAMGSVTLDEDDVALARAWLKRRQGWSDPEPVRRYEEAFAAWNGSSHAFAFMGGRVALSACIHALGLKPGDEVIIPGYTCVVVPNAFKYARVNVVYADIELQSFGLDAGSVRSKITERTRAVMVQHLYGLVSRDYDKVLALAEEHDLHVIEDCCHATGAEHHGVKVGNRGHVAFYSSEQSKIFTTIQGGMATTNDAEIADRLSRYQADAPYPDEAWIDRQLHNVVLNYYRFKHPQRWWRGDLAVLRYGHKRLVSTTQGECSGVRPQHYGRRMPAPIAVIGSNQLKKIDRYNERRRETALYWDDWCLSAGYGRPLVLAESLPVFLRYPVLVEPEKKRKPSWAKKELGVTLGVWFISHVHPAPRSIDGCPHADEAVRRCVNLPCLLD
ncbi:MAG: aminotransferase class I/II-fold pyridoxal phosphate-dependent enzyme [Candidatus Krumholzibacteria bacterium]